MDAEEAARRAFLFVVDGPVLELQSLLLAASLRAVNPGDAILAYRPRGAEEIAPATRAVFAALGVETREIPMDGADVWAKPYPHGNKILACNAPRDEAVSVFLDTDMVAARAYGAEGVPGPGEVAVVPEGVATWGKEGDRWARAYAHFGLPLPEERVRLTRRKRRLFLPYFNAGLVGFRSGGPFAESWLETAREADHRLPVGGKRPWLDQITLPIALKRARLAARVLAPEWNFSVSARPYEPGAQPVMVHYHRFRFLADWPEGQAAWAALKPVMPRAAVADVAGRLREAGLGYAR